MGMGFESISLFGAQPPLQTLISESALTSPMFGFKFAPSGSELFLGGVNPAYNKRSFTWVPLSAVVSQIFKCMSCRCLIHSSPFLGLLAGIL